MFIQILKTLALPAVLLLSISAPIFAEEEEPVRLDNSVKPAIEKLPEFRMKDPSGVEHSHTEFSGKKLVFVLSVPTKEQGSCQRAWIDGIKEQNSSSDQEYALVLVEDMTQSGNRDLVMDALKKNFIPNSLPLILIDDTGSFRKSMEAQPGLLTNKTTLLIYDEHGTLIHYDRRKPKGSTNMALK